MGKFQVTIRCTACRHRYKRVMSAEDEDSLAYVPDPPCPVCARATQVPKFEFNGKAPAAIGSLHVRAVDQTADIVMKDHGLTDMKDNVREGESSVMPLPPRQQAMADNFFSRPRGAGRRHSGDIFQLPPRAVLQAAVSGRFSTPDTVNPVATQHAAKSSAPIHIIAAAGAGGQIIGPKRA